MPTKITRSLHHNPVVGTQALGTGFTTGNVHAHDLTEYLPVFKSATTNFFGIVDTMQVVLTSATSATTVSIRLCEDPAGDIQLVPDVTATLSPGITTAGTKCAVFKVGAALRQDLLGPGNGTLYLFAKVDDATSGAVFTGSEIFWME